MSFNVRTSIRPALPIVAINDPPLPKQRADMQA
jgi:hypothetical protein